MEQVVIDVKDDQELFDEMQVVEKQAPISKEEEELSNIVTPVKSQYKDRHKQVECKICLRKMRSDTLKRHMLKHRELNTLDEEEIRDEIKRRKKLRETREDREQLVRKIAEEEGLPPEYYCDIEASDALIPVSVEKQLMEDEHIYSRTIERGKIITNVLEKGNVREESLSKENREALKLYRKQMSIRNLSSTELRVWQQELMDNMSTPSDREVTWIIGQKGNEGKTWFQEYLESFYGYSRVVRLDLKMKTSNVLHVLTRRPFSATDIFLFNEP